MIISTFGYQLVSGDTCSVRGLGWVNFCDVMLYGIFKEFCLTIYTESDGRETAFQSEDARMEDSSLRLVTL